MLMLASRLPGQASENWGGQVVACNHGTITFSVAQAYLYSKPFSGYQWQFEGWYNVDPGKCTDIGSPKDYHNGGLFSGKGSITLLAFAFYDSTGMWGVARLSDPGNVVFHPSNQQFCVKNDFFRYNRDSPGGDLPRGCDGAQTGYQMIPASFEYTGPVFSSRDGAFFQKNDFFVTLSPSDRAIPLGKQTSSGGASQSSSGAANNQRAAANAKNNPPPSVGAPRPVVRPAPASAALPQRPRLAPIMVGKVDVSHLAGLQRGDMAEYIASIFGPPSGPNGNVYARADGISIKANLAAGSPLEEVTATGKSSRGDADLLLNLLGKNESAAVLLLGPPKARESLWDIDNTDLIWTFPMDGRPSPQYANPGSIQTLTLHYRRGVGCESVNVVW
jgi:hypothetical protein